MNLATVNTPELMHELQRRLENNGYIVDLAEPEPRTGEYSAEEKAKWKRAAESVDTKRRFAHLEERLSNFSRFVDALQAQVAALKAYPPGTDLRYVENMPHLKQSGPDLLTQNTCYVCPECDRPGFPSVKRNACTACANDGRGESTLKSGPDPAAECVKRLRDLALLEHLSERGDYFVSCEKVSGVPPSTECNCGADEHNAEVEAVFAEALRVMR